MKKTLKILAAVMIFIFLILLTNISNAEEITLDKLAEKLNNSRFTRYYENFENRKFTARVNENKIEVVENDNVIFNYELNDNILSIAVTADDPNALLINLYATEMIDIVGEFYGYDVGEASGMIPSDESQITLEEYGVVIESTSDTSSIMKIDINKKMPLADTSGNYIKVEDLIKDENIKTRLTGEGKVSINGTKTNVDKYDLEDNKVVVCISESLGFTYQSYNTMLSVIEVMFDSKDARDYFKNNYSSINLGDKEFPGFKIEQYAKVTPEEDDNILGVYMPFTRVTIDKNMVNTELEKETDDELITNKDSNNNTIVEDSKMENEVNLEEIIEDEVLEENESVKKTLSEEEQLEQLIRTILILAVVLFVLLVLVLVRAIKRK